jgi:transposase
VQNTLVAVDLAKSFFEIVVSTSPGKVASGRRLTRATFLSCIAQMPKATVVMEACGSAHYWARELQELGHRVVLLPPAYVRPYVLRDKTDRADAKGLLEAYRNEAIKPVPIKTPQQQLLGALHRLREGWMSERTARINTLRGLLREQGIFIPQGARRVAPQVWAALEDADSGVPDALRPFLEEALHEISELERRIDMCESQLRALAKQIPAVERLMTIPGVGLLIATALVAFVGDAQRFPSTRHFASYLGLVPRERSSGSLRRLGRISKRGDVYLRTLLIHGARSALRAAATHAQPDRLRAWALEVQKRSGSKKAAVALANKIARVVWKLWRDDQASFQAFPHAA